MQLAVSEQYLFMPHILHHFRVIAVCWSNYCFWRGTNQCDFR